MKMLDSTLADGPREACGILGIYAPGEDVARLSFFGLYALQHRGQESAGIAVSDGKTARLHKAMGLVSQVFNEENLKPLRGHLAIGHNRYSTKGASRINNAQPFCWSPRWDRWDWRTMVTWLTRQSCATICFKGAWG